MNRIYIIDYGYSHDWIIGKIADDIVKTATQMGIQCRCGGFEDYDGEEICYHLAYHIAVPIQKAKHNSVFYTHLNNILKEDNLLSIRGKFDSYICMSPEDAQFLLELGFDKSKVYGKILPVRNSYIRPISIGIFSACYIDGRKNESWLIEYCKNNENAKYANFVFIGTGWEKVVMSLSECGCSFEWHNVSRTMPYEYQYQQNMLSNLNYYIYMGMDGGAMGAYDAYAQDVPLCITFDGFHKAIPHIDYSFDDKDSFFSQLKIILDKHVDRLSFFKDNCSENYVKWLLDVWNGKVSDEISTKDKECISYNSVLEKKRDQYYKLSFSQLKMYIEWRIYKYRIKRKYHL